MVPQEKLEMMQPTTLPADFSEWDGGEAPATQPADFNGFDAVIAPKSIPRPVAKPVPARPVVQRSQAAAYAEAEEFFQPHQRAVESRIDETGKNKKPVMYAAAGIAVLLLVLVPLGYMKMRSQPTTKQVTLVQPTMTAMSLPTNTSSQQAPTPATAQVAAVVPANQNTDVPRPPSAQLGVNSQVNSASRIARDVKVTNDKDAPPATGFGAESAEGLPVGNVFGGQSAPRVVPMRRMAISAGVAGGLLISKTPPVYPQIARAAKQSGTVVIQATISKTGSVRNPSVISGPQMLRGAALEAVKNWRYRPYLLNNEPVEVDTTVNVNFALGG